MNTIQRIVNIIKIKWWKFTKKRRPIYHGMFRESTLERMQGVAECMKEACNTPSDHNKYKLR